MRYLRTHAPVALLLSLTALALGCADNRTPQTPTSAEVVSPEPDDEFAHLSGWIPFADAEIYIEYNATANDAGIQVFLDAEDWRRVEIVDDHGRRLLDIKARGGMGELGLTELRFEGAEPEPSEVLEAFPAGAYEFRGATTDKQRLTATAFLSHDIPAAPVFSPSQGEAVSVNNVVIQWNAIGGIERYQVIVESDAFGMSLTVDLPPSVTSLNVPPSFLVPGTEYKAEVLAIAPSGNRTITEGTFVTTP